MGSPFEGFAERNNWLSISIENDCFSKTMLSCGVSESLLKAWSVDPQVNVGEGKKGSIFDQLEDLDAEACRDKVVALAKLNPMNAAFVFIKPHAVTDKVKALAKSGLEAKGIKILAEGSLTGEVIDQKKLIDNHYYAIASKATILKPDQLNVPNDKFEKQFGLTWQDALATGKVFNALDGCAHLGLDADQMGDAWNAAKKNDKLVKLGGGFYCGLVEVDGKEPVYVFNAFFMQMRSKFTKPGTEIYYFSVEWDPTSLPWADFRGKVLGPTDPAEAPAGSLRGEIMKNWKDLGLASEPNVGDNGMHASASPFEGFAERNNWLEVHISKDSFGGFLLGQGVEEKLIMDWSVDPQVTIDADGKKGSIFDQLEDLDVNDCADKVVALSKLASSTGTS